MNYGDEIVFYMCIFEYKYFILWEIYNSIIYFKEFSRVCGENDIFYYLIWLVNDKFLLEKYIVLVGKEKNVIFVGWFGMYCYMDMDVIIKEVLYLVSKILLNIRNNDKLKSFYYNEMVV